MLQRRLNRRKRALMITNSSNLKCREYEDYNSTSEFHKQVILKLSSIHRKPWHWSNLHLVMQMAQLYHELLTAIHFDTQWNIESKWKRYHNYTDLMRSENYFKVLEYSFLFAFLYFLLVMYCNFYNVKIIKVWNLKNKVLRVQVELGWPWAISRKYISAELWEIISYTVFIF